ncbi:outer membrane beta-barrel protein [Proteiniphilum sp.]|uniref:outer membrane beta-barrel protein n=1 Tax=Proteiniphilum sp. TaxID=1926877 RepID=UPI00332F45A3
MNSQWSDNLRKRMEAHEEPFPEGLWEDIEQIVTKELLFQTGKHPVQSASGQKKSLLWAKRIGAVAAIIWMLFFIGDFFLKEDTPYSPAITQKPGVEHKQENTPSIAQDHKGFLLMETEKGHRPPLAPDNNTVTWAALAPTASTDKKTDDSLMDKEKNRRDKADEESDSADLSKQPGEDPGMGEKATDPNMHYPIIIRQNKPARWQTNIYASNISSGSTKTYNGYRSFLSEEIAVREGDMAPLLVKNPHEGIVAANKQNMVYTEMKHRQPVTMGASVKYNVNEKWSLTSGLTYTILSSQLRSGSGSHYYTSEQTLHNIGIPLGINYNFWRGKDVSIYVSGGGQVEKNVHGKLITDYVVNDKLESTEKNHISINRLQWSVNSSIGIEYNLFSKIGLYVEPGVIYYFNNESEVETIYKEKPVNFNLRVGLRFSLGE